MSNYFDRLNELANEMMNIGSDVDKKRKDSRKLIDEIKEFIKNSKELMKITYQLAFIETSNDLSATKASEYLDELVARGLISKEMREKAHKDVLRWRKLFLDRNLLLPSVEHEDSGDVNE